MLKLKSRMVHVPESDSGYEGSGSVGKIINIGSMSSFFGGTTVPAYTAAKGAVTQLSKVLLLTAQTITSAATSSPGYMDTEMCANMTQERKDECTARIPAGRWGTPKRHQKIGFLFLASSASDYLSGAVIPVDGGYLVK